MTAETPKGPKTETIIRRYDAEGELISETITITTTATPKQDTMPDPGCYP